MPFPRRSRLTVEPAFPTLDFKSEKLEALRDVQEACASANG